MGLEKEDSVKDFNTLERDFVTWESNQIYNDDLQFISVDFILARIKELEDNREIYIKNGSLRTAYENTCLIDELKNLIE